ncbi:MAG: hypothetical protein J6D44_11480 [Pseudomonas sp.]|nr:hypothetical protein [Pseudomonas sp.]
MSKSYPYQAWVLTPSFAPKEVTIVEPGGWATDGWLPTIAGKHYHESEVFDSKDLAIEGGWSRLEEQEAAIQKKLDSINKKKSILTKHSK